MEEKFTVDTDYQVLASCFRVPGAITRFAQDINPQDVGYVHGYKGIYEIYKSIINYHRATRLNIVDPVGFQVWLESETDIYDSIGGESGLKDLYAQFMSMDLPAIDAIVKLVEFRANKRRKLDHVQTIQSLINKSDIEDADTQNKISTLAEEISNLYTDLEYNPLDAVRTANDIASGVDDLWDVPPFLPTPFKSLNVALGYSEEGGFFRGGVHTIVALSGQGKPLDIDTPVLISNGSYKNLGAIEVGDRVINSKGKPDMVVGVHDQGHLPTVLITTNSGRTIVSALDHGFYTSNGWVEAQDLNIGDLLARPKKIEFDSSNDRPLEEFRLAGYFIGDGATSSHNCNVTCFDDETVKDIQHCAESLGFKIRHVTRGRYDIIGSFGSGGNTKEKYNRSARKWLDDNDLNNRTSHTKRIPSWIFESSKEQKAAFLGAYFACDGHLDRFEKYKPTKSRGSQMRPQIIFYSVNKELLIDTQMLLSSIGIESKLRLKRGKYKGEAHLSWRLDVCGHSFHEFSSQIKCFSNKQTTLNKWARVVPTKPYKQYKVDDIFAQQYWSDEIVNIEPYIDRPCKCITVSEDSTFIANGIVVHNSTLAKNLCNHWLDSGYTVLFVNFEEAQSHWERILMTQMTGVNVYAEASKLTSTEMSQLSEKFKNRIASWGDRLMVRHDPDTLFFEDLEKWLRDILGYGARKPDIVVIDTIQSMFTKTGGKARWGEFEQIMVRLEKLAKDMDAAFVLTAQQNINSTKEKREVINQSDMGGSVTITQKSTVSMFITPRRGSGENNDDVSDRIMEIQIPKNRITGTAFIDSPPLIRYNDHTKSYEEYDPSKEDDRYNVEYVELQGEGSVY